MAFTVTATEGANPVNGILLRVRVLTGAAKAAAQAGATKTADTTSTPFFDQTITTTTAGSVVYGATANGNVSGAFTADARTTFSDNVTDATQGCQYGAFRATAATGTPGATVLGASAPTGDHGTWAAAEILAAGTIAEDGSGPAAVSSTSLHAVTTAAFTPPPGSLLVIQVAHCSSAVSSIVLTSTGGLTFTQRAYLSTAAGTGSGVWVADVPAPAARRRPPGTSRTAARARLGPRGLCAAGIAVASAVAVQPAVTARRPPAPVTRPAPARAHLGPLGRSAGGIASAVITPLGQPARPRPFVFRSPSRARGRLGRSGQPASGLASAIVTPLGPAPSPAPRPVITRPVPGRGHAGPAGRAAAGLASAIVTPRGTPGPGWRPQPRRPAAARAVWHGNAGPQAAAVTVTTAYQHAPPLPRSPGPRRALWHGLASQAVTPRGSLQARRPVVIAPPRAARARAGPAGACGDGNAGPPGIVPPAAQAYQRPAPAVRRPGPARAVTGHGTTAGGIRGPANQASVVTAAARPLPQPRRKPPARVLWHGGAGPQPAPAASAPPPRWRPLPARRRPRRAVTGGVRGLANALPPLFTPGVLTASSAPGSALTAAAQSAALTAATGGSQLTAATAATGTLTAGTQRTGGPS